ncbi:MAG TPA: aldo/keto reductase [Anaerolineales bacterium]|jgi:aryl-alcohol dehydrogenase-like predicted oxidoreductase|nr:aldo/keto reductase [Anaerolineales bacterium]
MEYRNLGRAGVKVSAIGIGCNQFGGKVDATGTKAIVQRALEEGINFFDTANVYGNPNGTSEEFVGAALEGQRDKVVLATKGRFKMGDGPNDVGASRYHIMNAVEASLRRLRTDHIDLYQIHAWDESVPVAEMMRALDDLVRAGKIRYIGTSQFSAWQLAHCNTFAEMMGWEHFVTIQTHYNMFERDAERELLPYCAWSNVGILPYFPLAGGLLTGKYTRGEPPPAGSRGEFSPYVKNRLTDANFDKLDKLRAFADSRGRTLHDLAFSWLLSHQQIPSVIAGATTPEQVSANAATVGWKLSDEELDEIKELL